MALYLAKPVVLFSVVTSVLLLTACGSTPTTTSLHSSPGESNYQSRYSPENELNQELYDHYQQWKGVRYRLGGLNKSGIDCSGFVYRAFRDKLGRDIPRTTTLQSHEGYRINKRDLRTGDLVFFKTGGQKQHVGIYLEKGMFMHASTSVGVTISRLDNRYWRQNYWQSRRLPL